MGGFAARKALEVVSHVETVLAIEILAACQALNFSNQIKRRNPLQKVYELVRSKVKPWDRDRHISPDIEALVFLFLLSSLLSILHLLLLSQSNLSHAVSDHIALDKNANKQWYHT